MYRIQLSLIGFILAFVLIYPTIWQATAASGELGDVTLSEKKEGQSDWWNTDWEFRIRITVNAAGYERQEKPAGMTLDFDALLSELGVTGLVNIDSLRVLEVDSSGGIIENDVPFQYDHDPGSSDKGILTILLTGITAADSERYYYLYFDLQGTGYFPPPDVSDRITVADNVTDEQNLSVMVATEIGTYYYDKEGGGFSSLDDNQGKDWINYSSASEAAGEFRGIPNLVPPAHGGYFHPGHSSVTTEIISQGPIKTNILSTTNDDKWQVLWEIFPRYAKLSVLKVPDNSNYWFLYEGTPGGSLDTGKDYVVRSNETQTLTSESWEEDLQNEEWVYFAEGDPAVNRSLFLAHHKDDSNKESYRPMSELMTVFGFARILSDSSNGYFTESGQQFTIGLVDDEDVTVLRSAIRSAYRDLAITLASPERRPYFLEIGTQGHGDVVVSPDLPEYAYGQEVVLHANAAPGWEFRDWLGDLLGEDPDPTIVIEGDMNITAVFEQKEYILTLQKTGLGSVSKSPDKQYYYFGDNVELDAIPATGWKFMGWDGDVSGIDSKTTLTITDNKTVHAQFEEIKYYLPALFFK